MVTGDSYDALVVFDRVFSALGSASPISLLASIRSAEPRRSRPRELVGPLGSASMPVDCDVSRHFQHRTRGRNRSPSRCV